jgi:tRNA nucleotidyltransferase/poly(A) polymerase
MKFVVIAAGTDDEMVRTSETASDALNQAALLMGMRHGLVTISDEAGREYAIDDFRRRFVDTTRQPAQPRSSKTEKEDIRRDMTGQSALRSRA